jgi:hypothetical protein
MGWAAAALVGVGLVGGVAVAAIAAAGIGAFSTSPTWWVFLQACSLPALLAAALLLCMANALRPRGQTAALRAAALAR